MNLTTMTTNNPVPRPIKKQKQKAAAEPSKRLTTLQIQENSTMTKTLKSGKPWPVKRQVNRLDELAKELKALEEREYEVQAREQALAQRKRALEARDQERIAALEAKIAAKAQELAGKEAALQQAEQDLDEFEQNLKQEEATRNPVATPTPNEMSATQPEFSNSLTPPSKPQSASETISAIPKGSYLFGLLNPKETSSDIPSTLNLPNAVAANSLTLPISTPTTTSTFSTIPTTDPAGSTVFALPTPAPLNITPVPDATPISTSALPSAPSPTPASPSKASPKPKKTGLQKFTRQVKKTPKKVWEARNEIAKVLFANGLVAFTAAYFSRAPVANELADRTIPVQQKAIAVQLQTLKVNQDPFQKLRDDLIHNDPCGAGYAYRKVLEKFPTFAQQTATRQLEVLSLDPNIRSKVKQLTAGERLTPTAGCSLFNP
jgi:hypothetical protein